MSDPPQPLGPFGGFGGFDLSQMMRFLQAEGPIHWDVARQVTRWVALEGDDEPPIDHTERVRLAEIAAAAEARVLAETGESPPTTSVDCLGVAEFADRILIGMRPLLERLSLTLTANQGELPPELGALAGMTGMLGPLLFGVQSGFMVGQVARSLLSQHDLLLPLESAPRPAFVVPSLAAFREAWSIPADDLRFFLALQEAVRSRIVARPWVREHLLAHALDYVSAFQVDPSAMEAKLGHIDLSDPSSFEKILGDPDAVLGAMQSPEQAVFLERMQAATALFESYADSVLARIGGPMLPSLGLIQEAIRRARAERTEADRFVARLLGLDPNRKAHGQAAAFCAGVVERAGPAGLDRLIEAPGNLPTASEVEAPGLWLARLDLST